MLCRTELPGIWYKIVVEIGRSLPGNWHWFGQYIPGIARKYWQGNSARCSQDLVDREAEEIHWFGQYIPGIGRILPGIQQGAYWAGKLTKTDWLGSQLILGKLTGICQENCIFVKVSQDTHLDIAKHTALGRRQRNTWNRAFQACISSPKPASGLHNTIWIYPLHTKQGSRSSLNIWNTCVMDTHCIYSTWSTSHQ